MAPYFSESLDELRARLIVPLPHACQVCDRLLTCSTIEICMELVLQIGPPSD
jgi:hypothetical protein